MAYILRKYQNEAVEAGVDSLLNSDKKNIIVLPTGSGKSLVIANIVKRLDGKTIVFQPNIEILDQNLGKTLHYGFQATVYSASAGMKKISSLMFGTIGTMISKVHLFQDVKHIIIDECHLTNAKGGMYLDFINKIPGVKVLGLTATPYRLSSDGYGGSMLKFLTRTRPRIFDDIIYIVQNKTLFNDGHLCKIDYFSIGKFDRTGLELNSTKAAYTESSLRKYSEKIDLDSKIIKAINRLIEIGRKGVLVFVDSIESANKVMEHVPECAFVNALTPKKERKQIVAKFRSGKIKVVVNVGVFTVGFDYPELDAIIMARATLSLALYYQIIGRGVRPHPNKDKLMFVDFCGNINIFGRVEDMIIKKDDKGKWAVFSEKMNKQLTNVYFVEKEKEKVTDLFKK